MFSRKTSILASQKRAEVDAARAKLSYALQEAKLKQEQTSIIIKLEVLEHETYLAAKEAEASFLERKSNRSLSEHIYLPKELVDTRERTRTYVQYMCSIANDTTDSNQQESMESSKKKTRMLIVVTIATNTIIKFML